MSELQRFFYIYIYFINGVAEYVGKGFNNRFLEHTKKWRKSARANRSTHWHNHLHSSIAKGREIKIEIIPCASDEEALALEIKTIAKFGRRDLGTGTLYNLTDGGEGACGVKMSEEAKRKIGQNSSAALKGRKLPQAHKDAISEGGKGLKRTAQTKARISAGLTGVKKPALSSRHKAYLSEFMSSTVWWNNGVVRKRSSTQPGPDFKQGWYLEAAQ
jgi:hypothetical protein